MQPGFGVQSAEAVFLLLLVFGAIFAGLARRLKVGYPILLVIAGLVFELSTGNAADWPGSESGISSVLTPAPLFGGVDAVVEGVSAELRQHSDACGGTSVFHDSGTGTGGGVVAARLRF